jgi:uncharacterized membrane protein YfcA
LTPSLEKSFDVPLRYADRRSARSNGGRPVLTDLVLLGLIGFAAQLVDGALGMAFGVISTTAMLSMGVPPAQASAIVHTAEIFTTAGSAASHIWHRNVDWRLVLRLGVAGVFGAVLGAWILSNLDATAVRPFIGAYLLLVGGFILFKAWRGVPARDAPAPWVAPIGFAAGFLDASGGGGWGPVATTTLVGSGHAPRTAVGSVNTTEFFVTIAAATTFFVELGASPWRELLALVIGGLLAAPLGGWAVQRIRPRTLMVAVGCLVIALSAWQIARAVKLPSW